jgi:phage repressor protein C with HTH and peptisase S24 domain
MLRHADVWRAIDRLAERHGLTPSGLAKRAGLDPTTFNKSKRITAEGKRRWPSTESVAKALAAVGASPGDFVQIVAEADASQLLPRLPLVPVSRLAASGGSLDEHGHPAPLAGPLQGGGLRARGAEADAVGGLLADPEEILFPGVDDPQAFALEIDDDAHLPHYRRGDLLIVSPGAHLRPGHRVALLRRGGRLHLGTLAAQSVDRVALEGAGPLAVDEVAWMSRILWVSQ